MRRDFTGLKIRTHRKQRGMTQAALAGLAGISPSYLNLIERNRRPVSAALLDRISSGLGIERAVLDDDVERRVVERLDEIGADPVLAGKGLRPAGAEMVVGAHRDWADLIVRLYEHYRDQSQAVVALADRLNRDPFLGESVHRMLTSVTAIRSAAQILEQGGQLPEKDRERFLSIIAHDSQRLAATANALVGFIQSTHVRVRSATPMEALDAFMVDCDNHFPDLEAAAGEFLSDLAPGESIESHASALLEREGVAAPAADLRSAPESSRFALVRAAMARIAGERMRELAERHRALTSPEARQLAVSALGNYAAGAALMPYERFLEMAERRRYDLDLLARLFGVSYEQAAHRVATLRRPGASGVRFAFMRSDASGYVTKRLPLPDLPLPRYGAACPLWPVYGAFQNPSLTVRQFGEIPSGVQFLFFARAVDKSFAPVSAPRRLLSVMLACAAEDASRVVYGDGLQREQATIPVGTVCRLCPRRDCRHRQEESLAV